LIMGDMGEVFREMTKRKKLKRAINTRDSTRFLIANGIKFESKNSGAHLIISEYNTGTINYWPSTGLWITKDGKRHRGVRNLVKYVLGE